MSLRNLTGFSIASLMMLATFSPCRAETASLSPEGRAIFDAFFGGPNPDMQKCTADRKAVEQMLIDEALKSEFDWPASKALLKKQSELQVACSRMANLRMIELMDRLPPADRANYFRRLHKPIEAPRIVEPRK